MTLKELDWWSQDFEVFHARFAHLFSRSEPREQSAKYMRALMAKIERKNGWQIAEEMGDNTPDRTQRLLYRSRWESDDACDILQQFSIETFGDEQGIGVVDETGFLKQGGDSVGVKRQYSGTAGKVDNCQIGVFLSYATPKGNVFLDRRLYLPEEWCADQERRAKAKIPDDVEFQTKPEQAIDMLLHAWEQGVPMGWVTGDEVYGDSPCLRDTVREHKRLYVLAVSSNSLVWSQRPGVVEPERKPGSRGRPRKKARLAQDAPPPVTVASVVNTWPAEQWERFSVAEGEKGPRIYDWAHMPVVENRSGLPGPDAWLLARRSVNDPAGSDPTGSDPTDIAYYLSNAPVDTTLMQLAQVASTRYTVEQCIEEAKGETGLDEYEVRYWHSWHRHITLSMMALAWLASVRHKESVKKGSMSQS
jgi:SRSO17 transposase